MTFRMRAVCGVILFLLSAHSGMAQVVNAPAVASAFPKLEDLKATRDRPLFAPTRRPPPPVAVPQSPTAASQPVSNLPNVELTGIVMGEDVRIAVLRDKSTNELQRLRRGDKIADWVLRELEPRSVVLERGGTSVTLRLFDTDQK
jgi:general secretion pathway protein N